MAKKEDKPKGLTYKDAGVDVDKANALVERIKSIAASTFIEGALGTIGGFSGKFSLKKFMGMKEPTLQSSTDGVGTKLKIAFKVGKHDTVGIDLVAMCINDILVDGTIPLFFLDYISMGKIDMEILEQIISGIADGCKQAKCALIGGETAEMPGFYGPGEYDMAGFSVGIVDEEDAIDASNIISGDQLIGLGSSGLHSNGYSLVRKICFDLLELSVDDYVEDLGCTLGEELLRPTYIYADAVQAIIKTQAAVAFANITGGGIPDNVERILPKSCSAVIKEENITEFPIFSFLQAAGKVETSEMRRTFNNGLGYVVVVRKGLAQSVLNEMSRIGQDAFHLGEIIPRGKKPVIFD